MKIARLIRPVPQWSAVGIAPPQRSISVHLSWKGESRDVTDDHSVASLKPLTIALGLDAGEEATLDFREDGRSLGTLRLTKSRSILAGPSPVTLYRIAAGEHRCLPRPIRNWQRWLQERAAKRNRAEHNFRMEPAALLQLMICYICPRPVVLVSVAAAGHFNIFPMDLIGSVGNGFALALRSTNISIPIMRRERRLVLSSLPAGMKPAAYALGEHHKAPLRELAALPFATRPSPLWGIASVAAALRTRELLIRHVEEVGSHTLFLADILFDEPLAQGAQLHHISGFYHCHRQQRGIAFPDA